MKTIKDAEAYLAKKHPGFEKYSVGATASLMIEYLEKEIKELSQKANFKKILETKSDGIFHLFDDEVTLWEKDGSIKKGDTLYKVILDKQY